MLCQLNIQNIALIDDLTIEFTEGLNVLTGETGAGKSIVIDSMNLALGERADRDLIREGSQRAQVHALFDIENHPSAIAFLRENGIEVEGGELVVLRELSASGRNVVRINAGLVPLALLKQLSTMLVDVHGQHEHQSLLDEERHLYFLDAFGANELADAKAQVRQAYDDWQQKAKRFARVVGNAQMRAQRLDMLRFQYAEINDAGLTPGEEEELQSKRELFRNGERIALALNGAISCLEGEEGGALDAIRQATAQVGSIAKYAKEYQALEELLNDAMYALEEADSQLFDRIEELEFDPREMEVVEQRLEDIKTLKRKYGSSIDEILAYFETIGEEIQTLEEDEQDSGQLEEEMRRAEETLIEAELALSSKRRAVARKFEDALLAQLKDLGMEKAQFIVEFPEGPANTHTPDGVDKPRFMMSANQGEPMRSLAKTASGGELSRIMLAFKTICAGDVSTMVFDEIDTGISGRMAQVVGEKMAAIGQEKQVICVTHLPQIAALGHSHHLVEKFDDGKRTYTMVKQMTMEERGLELARMIGGKELTAAAQTHAKDMLQQAAKLQEGLTKR